MAPAPLFDMLGGFSFYIISAAANLNLFEMLNKKEMTAADLATETGTDKNGFTVLLECLESLGYVKKKNGRYGITKMTSKWCLDSSAVNFKHAFDYYHLTMMDIWPHLSESVRAGKEHINFYDWLKDKPATAGSYQKFMMSLAAMNIPDILKKISLKKEKVLDIGGSHGLYSISLSRKFRDIEVTVIDSEYSMPLLKTTIESEGLNDRVHTVTADFMNHTFKYGFDAILLFNVIHEHKEDYNLAIIEKIYNSLNPGGRVIILESTADRKILPSSDFAVKMYSLLFFHFLGGRNYSSSEINSWLKKCGFRKIKRKSIYKSGFTIIEAWK
jgi:SAM-dependent methyltransferase